MRIKAEKMRKSRIHGVGRYNQNIIWKESEEPVDKSEKQSEESDEQTLIDKRRTK